MSKGIQLILVGLYIRTMAPDREPLLPLTSIMVCSFYGGVCVCLYNVMYCTYSGLFSSDD